MRSTARRVASITSIALSTLCFPLTFGNSSSGRYLALSARFTHSAFASSSYCLADDFTRAARTLGCTYTRVHSAVAAAYLISLAECPKSTSNLGRKLSLVSPYLRFKAISAREVCSKLTLRRKKRVGRRRRLVSHVSARKANSNMGFPPEEPFVSSALRPSSCHANAAATPNKWMSRGTCSFTSRVWRITTLIY